MKMIHILFSSELWESILQYKKHIFGKKILKPPSFPLIAPASLYVREEIYYLT